MRKFMTIRRVKVHSTGRMVLLGSFALAGFALWYAAPTVCTHLLCINIVLADRSSLVPHGTSNPHGERDEAPSRRDDGARARAYPMS